MPNSLAGETSPYLLQHKDNPVDWYPWGPAAFASAKLQDKPVLLSIGYSSCHWCHVMAHESFENPEIAALMNRLFVNIKVDREERPDVDAIYMAAVQAMTQSGGWPLTVFLTPEGRPFFGGTYFPSEDRRGHPGFPRVLEAVATAFRTKRGELLTESSKVIGAIQAQAAPRRSAEPLDRDVIVQGFLGLVSQSDEAEGGFGLQPKFPQPLTFEFLLRYWHATGSDQALSAVTLTLEKMARGGLHDQLGGGFHRYSTDNVWLVPHFEKMLYDNALLASLYLHGWQATGAPLFREVVESTVGYMLREMADPAGGFYSATDADSEGEEGKFFVWVPAEIEAVLGPELARVAESYWGVSRDGNFEGHSILHVPRPPADVAAELKMDVEALAAAVEQARAMLYEARKSRVPPGLDDKVLTSWNALTLKALAECAAVLDRPDWLAAARRTAEFLLSQPVKDGRLQRTWKAGAGRHGTAKQNAFLEDYAALIDALLTLYEADPEPRWLAEATRLAAEMKRLFWSEAEGVFYDTSADHETLIVRPRDIFDNATPAGGSTAAMALLRLSALTGEQSHEEDAVRSMASVRDYMGQAPQGFANWLCALDFQLARRQEIVVIGPRGEPATRALWSAARRGYAPNRVYAGAPGPVADASPEAAMPLLSGRTMIGGRPTAYVCENYACQLPVTTPEALAEQLEAARGA